MKFISVFALILSTAALAVTLYREFESHKIVRTPANQTQKANETNQNLEDELLILRMRLAALEKKTQVQKASESAPLPKLQEQVAELTTFQEDLAEYTLSIDPLGVIEVAEREVEEAYTTLMDESLSPWVRAKQAALLKRYDQFDQDAVDSMNKLFFSVEDPNQQAAALVALKGHVTPDIRDRVLETFQTEVENGYKSGRFRYVGIEALQPLLPNPEVEAMLTHLAQNDPEPKISGLAARAMGLPSNEKGSGPKEVDSAESAKGGTDRDG